MAEKEILPKIFVFYTNGRVGDYPSEEKALNAIRNHDFLASEVVKVIIGNELDMVTDIVETVHCFAHKGKARKPTCKVDRSRRPNDFGCKMD